MIRDRANYISVSDLAELVDASAKTIRREINKGELSAIRIGTIYRILKSDALSWLEKKKLIVGGVNENDK